MPFYKKLFTFSNLQICVCIFKYISLNTKEGFVIYIYIYELMLFSF